MSEWMDEWMNGRKGEIMVRQLMSYWLVHLLHFSVTHCVTFLPPTTASTNNGCLFTEDEDKGTTRPQVGINEAATSLSFAISLSQS